MAHVTWASISMTNSCDLNCKKCLLAHAIILILKLKLISKDFEKDLKSLAALICLISVFLE